MNILSKVTWKAMWKNKTRTVVTIIGIILSAAMFMAVVTLGMSLQDFLFRGYIYQIGDYYVNFNMATEDQKAAMLADERVSEVADLQGHGFFSVVQEGDTEGSWNAFLLASANETYLENMPVRLISGRLPENSGEIVLSQEISTLLDAAGIPAELGDTLTLDICTDTEYYGSEHPEVELKNYSISYTVVGVVEDISNITGLWMETALTVTDGGEPDAIWHCLYAKTYDPNDAYDVVSEDYGLHGYTNSDVLMLLGSTRYDNLNTFLAGICAVLIAIIMVGSVSLIYNAFSISVSERTKQFGLLSSVGATRKQLRQSVFFEAGVLCALGIPLGLVSGWAGIAVVLKLLGSVIRSMFSFGDAIELYALVSLPGTLCAAAIGIATVFISAAIPAGRATKISPVAAIRQTGDYKAQAKDVKVGKLTYKLFGLPGAMAKKYYTISRKKYRSTVISLAISVVLFISAASFGAELRGTASFTANVHNYDIVCYAYTKERMSLLEELVEMNGVEEAVWVGGGSGTTTVLSTADANEYFLHYHELNWTDAYYEGSGYMTPDVSIAYVQDDKLRSWLEANGIDPAPYFDAEDPLALVLELSGTFYERTADGKADRYTQTAYPVSDAVTELPLYPMSYAWIDAMGQEIEDCDFRYMTTEDGKFLCHIIPGDAYYMAEDPEALVSDLTVGSFVLLEQTGGEIRYYRYDPLTGTKGPEPLLTQPVERASIRLGARVDNFDLSINDNSFYNINLVLPLSMKPEAGGWYLGLKVNTSGVEEIRAFIEENGISANDFLADEQQIRGILLVIDVFSYGFIILISLICVANVFNTISTNIALRRRDFGMLRSTGMKTGELYRMMNFECLIYGSRALLWGLPIGTLASYGIFRIAQTAYSASFAPPWSAMAVAAVCVFLVVFASMFYAVSKLKKDNPIEAIRMENL